VKKTLPGYQREETERVTAFRSLVTAAEYD
jgi:hypothetical protein